MKTYNKLVRDFIPAIIMGSGSTPVWRHVNNQDELLGFISLKIEEELEELMTADSHLQRVEEAADFYEVFLKLLQTYGIDISDVHDKAYSKRMSRGGFVSNIILESVES